MEETNNGGRCGKNLAKLAKMMCSVGIDSGGN